MSKDQLLSDYNDFDWSADEAFQSYLNRLEPSPPVGEPLEKRKRKWYQQNVQPEFKPEWLAPKTKPVEPVTKERDAPKYNPGPSAHYIPPVSKHASNLMLYSTGIGFVAYLVSFIPYLGSFGVPLPVFGVVLTPFIIAAMCFMGNLYRMSGGMRVSLSLDVVKQSPLINNMEVLISMVILSLAITTSSRNLMLPPAIHIIEEITCDPKIRAMVDTSSKKYFKNYPTALESVKQAMGAPASMSDDVLLGTHIIPMIPKYASFLRYQLEILMIIVIIIQLVQVVFSPSLHPFAHSLIYIICMKNRYLSSADSRQMFCEMNKQLEGYMPNAVIEYYRKLTSIIHTWANSTK